MLVNSAGVGRELGLVADCCYHVLRRWLNKQPDRACRGFPAEGEGMQEPHVGRLLQLLDRNPDGIVVTDAAAGEDLTAAQFLRRVRRTATALSALGVTAGSRVVVGLPPGRLLVEAAFGCFFSGAIPAFLDPTIDPQALSRCLDELEPAAVLTDQAIDGVPVVTSEQFGVSADAADESASACDSYSADSIVMLMYTSGTTGLPKGAVWNWENCDSQLNFYAKREATSEFILFPMSSFNAVALGCRAILPNFSTFAPRSVDLPHLIAQFDAHPAEYMFGSPELWRRYLDHTASGNRGFAHPPATVATAGAAIGRGLVAAMCEEFGNSTVLIPYAATEGLMPLTQITGETFLEQTAQWPIAEHGIPLGSPCDDVTIAVIDPDKTFDGAPAQARDFLPDGTVGELCISGRRASPAYYRRPKANAYAKFRDNGGNLWHRMGDIGHVQDGAVWLRCRKKDLMTLPQGGWLYSDQIEQSINDAIGSRMCAAVVIADRLTVVFPSTEPITSGGAAAIIDTIRELEIDADVLIVDGDLPVDSRHNSKIDRTALVKPLSSLAGSA